MYSNTVQNAPLTADEEAAWRALARVVIILPRLMDAELLRRGNLTLNEYTVLMVLSESPERSRRMNDLIGEVLITPSGLTRLMERLERQGMVTRRKASSDARGQIAELTDAGLDLLRKAWPGHLDDVRRIVLDNLRGLDLPTLTRALDAIAAYDLDPGSARRRLRPRPASPWAGAVLPPLWLVRQLAELDEFEAERFQLGHYAIQRGMVGEQARQDRIVAARLCPQAGERRAKGLA
jgi:DNA-binding MarR family transcriptional regulator